MAVEIQVSGHKYKSKALPKYLKEIAKDIPKQLSKEMEKKVKSYVVDNVSDYAKLIQKYMIEEYKQEFEKRVKILTKAEKGFDKWVAEKIADLTRTAVKEQRWKHKWKPLNPKYKAWKIRKGLDPRILIAYGYYINSIKVYRSNKDWVVGVDPFQIHPKTGIRMKKLARYLEYGTSRMPARPHWRPAFEHVRKHIDRYIKKYLKEKGIK